MIGAGCLKKKLTCLLMGVSFMIRHECQVALNLIIPTAFIKRIIW